MMDIDEERKRFEAWISAPPYEKSIVTCRSNWPGQYKDYRVQLAWEAWLARAQGSDA